MRPQATRPPQLVAVGGVSLLMLAVGMIAPANWVNLRLSAPDVGGAIMPPSMMMDRDTPSLARGLFLTPRERRRPHPRFVP